MKKSNLKNLIVALACSSMLLGCAAHEEPKWSKPKETAVYSIAGRQLPLQPTYNPVKWVRPPEVLPSRNVNKASASPLIKPMVSFTVKNSSLEETSLVLANALGYRSYCSSQIAKRTFTLEMIGTIDEIAATIEKIAGIKVAIDHDTKDVRFLVGNSVIPKFAEKR